MVATAKKDQTFLDADEIAALASGKAFDRTERRQICTVEELEVVPADEDWLARRQYDFRSPQWQALFPEGYPVLKIGLRGVDVRFAFSVDEINRVYIPIRHPLGHQKAGKVKGRNSQLHIVLDALKQVYGANPFIAADAAKVLAAPPAVWGQHLGDMDVEGESQKREWGWDIPRELLPATFKYQGEVRIIQGRASETGNGSGSAVGTAQLSDAESDEAVAEALVGLEGADFKAHEAAVLGLKGLSGGWYDLVTSGGNVAQTAAEKGLIVALEDGTIGRPEAPEAPEA